MAQATPRQIMQSTDNLLAQLNSIIALDAPAVVITNQCLLIKQRMDEMIETLGDPRQTEVIGG